MGLSKAEGVSLRVRSARETFRGSADHAEIHHELVVVDDDDDDDDESRSRGQGMRDAGRFRGGLPTVRPPPSPRGGEREGEGSRARARARARVRGAQ